jgi:hypothetical protein
VDSLADFPLDRRMTDGGEMYLASDAQELYVCSPADNIWLASRSESMAMRMAAGEKPQREETSEQSAAPTLMKDMASDPDWIGAVSFDVSQSERPDLGPMAAMLAQDSTNPELAELAAFAPAIQQAVSTINSAGFSVGRTGNDFVLSAQMLFADQETSEEIRRAFVMLLGLAGGEATKNELGFMKNIFDRVDIQASQQTVSVSVTISDADIEAAKTKLDEI